MVAVLSRHQDSVQVEGISVHPFAPLQQQMLCCSGLTGRHPMMMQAHGMHIQKQSMLCFPHGSGRKPALSFEISSRSQVA